MDRCDQFARRSVELAVVNELDYVLARDQFVQHHFSATLRRSTSGRLSRDPRIRLAGSWVAADHNVVVANFDQRSDKRDVAEATVDSIANRVAELECRRLEIELDRAGFNRVASNFHKGTPFPAPPAVQAAVNEDERRQCSSLCGNGIPEALFTSPQEAPIAASQSVKYTP
jgi:hypothetical protein